MEFQVYLSEPFCVLRVLLVVFVSEEAIPTILSLLGAFYLLISAIKVVTFSYPPKECIYQLLGKPSWDSSASIVRQHTIL